MKRAFQALIFGIQKLGAVPVLAEPEPSRSTLNLYLCQEIMDSTLTEERYSDGAGECLWRIKCCTFATWIAAARSLAIVCSARSSGPDSLTKTTAIS